MGSQRNNFIVLGLVAVLIAVAAYIIFVRQPVSQATQLGLDLKGGISVQLKGSHGNGKPVTRQEMQTAVQVIQQRVNALGVSEPEIQQQGTDEVIVNIPGLTNRQQAVNTIGKTAQLGFYEVLASDPAFTGQPRVVPKDQVQKTEKQIRQTLKNDPAYKKGKTKILFEESPPLGGGSGVSVTGYIFHDQPELTGAVLKGATLNRSQNGKLEVDMNLTNAGASKFGDFSEKIVNNALSSGQPGNGRLAIVLDKGVVSAPTVTQRLDQGTVAITNDGLPNGIPEAEAQQLQVVLSTGALPVNMNVLSVQQIGPTLGADSLKSGLLAALVGFGLVLVFLLVVYRTLGIVADIALLIYAFLLWGIVVAIPITMTLPGIASIVLSIGVAADANIVIFERIKEEVRRGKTPRSAIQLGYQKGFRAILDGNLTTLITAFILFALSSGSVRGFAVLLSIGVALSMFTAIVVTRALLGVLSGQGFHLSSGMMGVPKKEVSGKQPAGVR
ncbi:MAG: protein translocase subunit SecD [Rubrobacteraceae bacterium]